MPQSASTPPVCRDCDGFATATITTGARDSDGTRTTLRVHCPTCRGLGHTAPAVLVRLGR
ncbi:hypothetical protein OHS33_24955 [Streptomyces sp. NBC_00536]|uniref:hypothetical protein n=1 Tax=Streptomyces sp. NBC_00536 TaxID=2975769 RepID=UPI002E8074DF|nr:hypothetical protein [Streptomyces sp. NBC_00536]WUC81298.1 hypothetical protein OHS33_24955 [Streptomyces sp. NBC_00536]